MKRLTDSLRSALCVSAAVCVFVMTEPCSWAAKAERISLSSMGAQGDDWSHVPAVSEDGRFVVFYSQAANLVPGDTNGAHDVFVRDRATDTTVRVSLTSDGQEGDRDSRWPDISADGRFVAFESEATNLAPGAPGYNMDIFVHDTSTGDTEIVSVNSLGERGTHWSWKPTISADGRFVAFASGSTNLVPDDTNDCSDVFVYDREARQTERVSVSSDGVQGNANSGHDWARAAISDDGRCVAFVSDAANLVLGDTNGVRDVFVHDRGTGVTERVSVSSAGEEGNGPCEMGGWTHGDVSINGDGRFVAFVSHASNLVAGDTNGMADVFVRDRATDSTERVSVSSRGEQADQEAYDTAVSADGRSVVFTSHAHNLVPGDATGAKQVYLRDRAVRATHLVSTRPSGQPSLHDSMHPSVTADGYLVCMASDAPDLVPADTNGTWDIFACDNVHALWSSGSGAPTRVRGTVWVLPPAYEFAVSGRGHLSLEIGVTPGLYPEGAHSHDVFGPRVGVLVYPEGGLEGLALYGALGEFAELGLWGVWRAAKDSSGGRRGLAFRLGVGVIGAGTREGLVGTGPVIGAAAGFSF